MHDKVTAANHDYMGAYVASVDHTLFLVAVEENASEARAAIAREIGEPPHSGRIGTLVKIAKPVVGCPTGVVSPEFFNKFFR